MGNDSAPTTGQTGWLQVTPTIKLFYRDFNSSNRRAVPILGIPGYWRNGKDFIELAEHVSAGRRVVLVDMRGRGESSRSDNVSDYAFDCLLQDIKLLMGTLDMQRAIFLGTALGVHLAWLLAMAEPEYVAGMIINDTGPEPPSASSTQNMASFASGDAFTFDQAVARIREQNASSFPRFGDAEWERMMRRAYRQNDDGHWVRDFDQRTNDILPAMKARYPDFWREYTATGDIPVAILRGENSHYLMPDVANRMVAEHRHASLYTVPGSGHAPTLWEPEALAAVSEFLTKFDAGTAR